MPPTSDLRPHILSAPHTPPTASARPHLPAPPPPPVPLLPAPASPLQSLPTRSGIRGSSPADPCARRTADSLRAAISPGLPSGTNALHPPRRTHSLQSAPASAPPGSGTLAPAPLLRYTARLRC